MTDDELRTLVRLCGWNGKLMRAITKQMGWRRDEWYTNYKGAFGDQLTRIAAEGVDRVR